MKGYSKGEEKGTWKTWSEEEENRNGDTVSLTKEGPGRGRGEIAWLGEEGKKKQKEI